MFLVYIYVRFFISEVSESYILSNSYFFFLLFFDLLVGVFLRLWQILK